MPLLVTQSLLTVTGSLTGLLDGRSNVSLRTSIKFRLLSHRFNFHLSFTNVQYNAAVSNSSENVTA